MKTKATAKFVGTSARKIGLVAALVRGLGASEAQALLAATDKRAAGPVGQALNSAIANAENNLNTRKANLIIEAVLVGPGPTLKRFRPRAKGSASAIRKRSSHITVVVSDQSAPIAHRSPQSAKPKQQNTKLATSDDATQSQKPAVASSKRKEAK